MGNKTDVWQGTLALMILKTLETMGAMARRSVAEEEYRAQLSVAFGALAVVLPLRAGGRSLRAMEF